MKTPWRPCGKISTHFRHRKQHGPRAAAERTTSDPAGAGSAPAGLRGLAAKGRRFGSGSVVVVAGFSPAFSTLKGASTPQNKTLPAFLPGPKNRQGYGIVRQTIWDLARDAPLSSNLQRTGCGPGGG